MYSLNLLFPLEPIELLDDYPRTKVYVNLACGLGSGVGDLPKKSGSEEAGLGPRDLRFTTSVLGQPKSTAGLIDRTSICTGTSRSVPTIKSNGQRKLERGLVQGKILAHVGKHKCRLRAQTTPRPIEGKITSQAYGFVRRCPPSASKAWRTRPSTAAQIRDLPWLMHLDGSRISPRYVQTLSIGAKTTLGPSLVTKLAGGLAPEEWKAIRRGFVYGFWPVQPKLPFAFCLGFPF